MDLRHFYASHNFSLIFGLHLGRHLGYIEMLNDARVASLGFFKDNVCTTRINKEKKLKIKFQVLLKFAWILPDYHVYSKHHIKIRAKLLLRSIFSVLCSLFIQWEWNKSFLCMMILLLIQYFGQRPLSRKKNPLQFQLHSHWSTILYLFILMSDITSPWA